VPRVWNALFAKLFERKSHINNPVGIDGVARRVAHKGGCGCIAVKHFESIQESVGVESRADYVLGTDVVCVLSAGLLEHHGAGNGNNVATQYPATIVTQASNFMRHDTCNCITVPTHSVGERCEKFCFVVLNN